MLRSSNIVVSAPFAIELTSACRLNCIWSSCNIECLILTWSEYQIRFLFLWFFWRTHHILWGSRGSLSYRQVCLTRCAEICHAWVVLAVSSQAGPPRWRSCKYWNFHKSIKSISKLIQNRRAQIYENGDSGGLGAPRGSLEAFGSQDGAQDRQEQAQKAPRGAPRGQHDAKIRLSWRQDAVMLASLAPKMADGWPPWRFQIDNMSCLTFFFIRFARSQLYDFLRPFCSRGVTKKQKIVKLECFFKKY